MTKLPKINELCRKYDNELTEFKQIECQLDNYLDKIQDLECRNIEVSKHVNSTFQKHGEVLFDTQVQIVEMSPETFKNQM